MSKDLLPKRYGVKLNFECKKKFPKGFVKKKFYTKKILFKKILVPKIILSPNLFSAANEILCPKTSGLNKMLCLKSVEKNSVQNYMD